MKKKLMRSILAVAVIATFFVANLTFAKESEPVQNDMQVIDAEDIGIKTVETEVLEDEVMVIEAESEVLDAEPVYEEDVEYEEPETDHEIQEEESEPEETEPKEEEVESPEPPEGMVEGYEKGVYFYPNENDCEIREECYKCEDDDHIYAHSVCMDDRGYVLDEWCTICGHGTSKRITDEEFEALGVECDVEF